MMQQIMESILERRAERIAQVVLPHLPKVGHILDVGSGTGHNARRMAANSGLEFLETDVVDMHTVGRGPVLFDGSTLPFPDGAFAATLLLFALHYVVDPVGILRELGRVTNGRVLVLQSTYSDRTGNWLLRLREFVTGRVAFTAAKASGLIQTPHCSLYPQQFFTRPELVAVMQQSGLRVQSVHRYDHLGRWVSRDLYVLETCS